MSTILNPYIPRYLLHTELYYTQRGGFMDYLEWFYQRISELRIQKGVSARDMSLSLGQSESYINKIENKRTLPSMTGFFYICDYLNITPQEFFQHGCHRAAEVKGAAARDRTSDTGAGRPHHAGGAGFDQGQVTVHKKEPPRAVLFCAMCRYILLPFSTTTARALASFRSCRSFMGGSCWRSSPCSIHTGRTAPRTAAPDPPP